MAHNEFNEIRNAAAALPPEQMQRLRDELDRKLAGLTAAPLNDQGDSEADPFWGLMRDDAELMDEIVADAYRQRRDGKWREFDL